MRVLEHGVPEAIRRAGAGSRLHLPCREARRRPRAGKPGRFPRARAAVEATQIKGDGEAHAFLSPNDEFADYETWDKGNLDLSELKKPEMLEFEYARSALKNGLKLEQQLGTNPYKFGMVGSTDSHTGLTAVEEDNF